MRAGGYAVTTPDLPYDDPGTTYAERVQPAIDALEGTQRPVVLGHSLAAGYAPLVAAAVPGATLAYLCPAPVGPFDNCGAPMRGSREGFPFPANGPDGNSAWEPDAAVASMYPRLPADVASGLAQRLKPGSAPADPYPLRAHPDVPVTFIYAAHDEFFNPEWSRWIARQVVRVEPIEIDSGHFPMIETPNELALLLAREAASGLRARSGPPRASRLRTR